MLRPYISSRLYGERISVGDLSEEKQQAVQNSLGYFEDEVEWHVLIDTQEKEKLLYSRFTPQWSDAEDETWCPSIHEWTSFLKEHDMMPVSLEVDARKVALREARVTVSPRHGEIIVNEDGTMLCPFERSNRHLVFVSRKPVIRMCLMRGCISISIIRETLKVKPVSELVGRFAGIRKGGSIQLEQKLVYRPIEKLPSAMALKFADAIAFLLDFKRFAVPMYALDGVIGDA